MIPGIYSCQDGHQNNCESLGFTTNIFLISIGRNLEHTLDLNVYFNQLPLRAG